MLRSATSPASATAHTRASPVHVRPYSSAFLAARQRIAARMQGLSLVHAQHPFEWAQASSGLPIESPVRIRHTSSPRNASQSDIRARPFSVVSSTSMPMVDPTCSAAAAVSTDDKTPKTIENSKTQKKSAFVPATASVSANVSASVMLTRQRYDRIRRLTESRLVRLASQYPDYVTLPPHLVSSSGSAPGSSPSSLGSASSCYVTALEYLPDSSSGSSPGSGSLSSGMAAQRHHVSSSSGSSPGSGSSSSSGMAAQRHHVSSSGSSSGSGSGSSPAAVQHHRVSSSSRSASPPIFAFPYIDTGRHFGIKEAWAHVIAAEEREERLKLSRAKPSPEVDPVPKSSPKSSPKVSPVPVRSRWPRRPFFSKIPVLSRPIPPRPVTPQPVTPQRVTPHPVTHSYVLSEISSPSRFGPAPVSPGPFASTIIPSESISPAPILPPHVSNTHISPPAAHPAQVPTPDLSWRPPKRKLRNFPSTATEVLRRCREVKEAKIAAGNPDPSLASIWNEISYMRPRSPDTCPRAPSESAQPSTQPVVQSPPQPAVQPLPQPAVQPLPRTPGSQTPAPEWIRTMHTRYSSPVTVELYPSDAPSPRTSQLDLWRQLSKLPLDDQIAGRALTPPPAPKEPTPAPSPLEPSDVDLSDDLLDGDIPMYQLAAMMAKARDGTPEPPSRPETPSILRDGLTGYSLTPPRFWWKNEPTPPRKNPRKYYEDDSDFTYDFSRTVSTPDATIQSNCSLGYQQEREKELQRQVKALKKALEMTTRPANWSPPARPANPSPPSLSWSDSPIPGRSPSPTPRAAEFSLPPRPAAPSPPGWSSSPPQQTIVFVDEDGNTLDCQDGPAPPHPAPSACRKVPMALLPTSRSFTPRVAIMHNIQSVAPSPSVETAQSSAPSWGTIGLAAAAGIAGIALGFAARWMMS